MRLCQQLRYRELAEASVPKDRSFQFGVTDEQALCMLVQGSTAWHILKTVGHLQPGETVVVHAAAGGVGTIAIQLAKLWGAKVIAVASSEGKRALATSLGADAVVEATHEN